MSHALSALLVMLLTLGLSGCTQLRTAPSPATTKAVTQSVDVLLVAYDHGDGQAFRTLLPELQERHIRWHLIAFGPAAELFSGSEQITLLDSYVPPEEALQWKNNRRAELPAALTARLFDQFRPTLVLSGMAHAAQAKLVRQWWQRGAWTIAFYDNYAPPADQHWIEPWWEVAPPLEELWVPDHALVSHFPAQTGRSKGVIAIEHPTLTQWTMQQATEDRTALRQTLGLDKRPVVLLAGGYGETYMESFDLVAQAARLRPDLQWLLAPHPRTKGADEASLLARMRPAPIRMVTDIPTVRLASVADLVIVHRSTVGTLANQLGIPTLFVQPHAQPSSDKQARKYTINSQQSLLNTIHRELDIAHSHQHKRAPVALPTIVSLLEKRLQENTSPPPILESIEDSAAAQSPASIVPPKG